MLKTSISSNTSNNSLLDLLTFTHESKVEAIVYSILFLFAAGGNVPSLISLIKKRRRKSRIQTMILHLAIADIIITFIMIPLEVAWRITVEWIAGDIPCRIMLSLRVFGPYLSSMVLVCISMDRYSAIVHPLMRSDDAQRRAKKMLLIAWAISFVCSVPQSVIFHVERHPVHQNFEQCVSSNFFTADYQKVMYEIFCIMALYGVPLIVIVFCYARILWQIRMRSKRTNNTPTDGRKRRTGQSRLRQSDMSHIQRVRTRTLKMTIIIVFIFFFCWTPYVVIDLWHLFDPVSAEATGPRIKTSLFIFGVSRCFINPLVYGIYILNFAGFFKKMVQCKSVDKTISRQASAVTRFTQVDRCHGSDYLSSIAVDHLHGPRVRETEHITGSCLELKAATPIRRPLSQILIQGVEEDLDLAYSYKSSSSQSNSCSDCCPEEANTSFN